MTTIEIILLIGVLAFVVLVIFLARVLSRLFVTVNKINHSLTILQKQIADLDHEPKKILSNANDLLADVNHKLKDFEPLFGAISNIGQVLETRTSTFKVRDIPSDFSAKSEDKISEFIDLGIVGLSLWQKLRKRS